MLPNYTIRESARAKHVSLKVSAVGKLEVIVPQGYDQRHIPDIVRRKQNWIERVTRRLATQQVSGSTASESLPQQIALPAIAETWQVEVCRTELPGVRVTEQANARLVLFGKIDHDEVCNLAMQQWIHHKALIHLVPWLQRVSQEIDLSFKKASVRGQKTRWGSCSSNQSISLNCKLLFLPSPLVRYVLIHELCHTVHMNHSAKFWALVSQFEPNYRQLDMNLRDARYSVPGWMEKG